MRTELFTIVAVLATLICGCGASSPPVARPTSPFTAQDAEVFDEGVDFVMDPTVLEGRWRDDWTHDVASRVKRADLVALVQVNTLRTDTDPDQKTTYRIVADVQHAWQGQAPSDEITLPVREGDSGFAAVSSNEPRILNHSFVLFVKWYQDPQGKVVPRFHLSPASHPITARVQYLIHRAREAAEPGTRRVIIEQQ